MIHFFFRRIVKTATKVKTLVIKSQIGEHDLNIKLNQSKRFLEKGLIVQINFEHFDTKHKRRWERISKEKNEPPNQNVGWIRDNDAKIRIIEKSLDTLKSYFKSSSKKDSPYLVSVQLTPKDAE
eukprot:NODE_157_length_15108_cov_0.423079.p13 type:complete len:124 gc:universal NODE_157_length_15108_cov_0.423079:6228-5857(-)